MDAIKAIVNTYIRLKDEGALIGLKSHRAHVLETTRSDNPMFSKLRAQCNEEIEFIDAALARLRDRPEPRQPEVTEPAEQEVSPMTSDDLQFIDFGAGRGASLEFAAKCAPGTGLAIDISDDAVARCRTQGIATEIADVLDFDRKNAATATFAINLMQELPGRSAFVRAMTNIIRAAKNYCVIQHPYFDRDPKLALNGLYVADNFGKKILFKPTIADYLQFIATHRQPLGISGIAVFTFGEAELKGFDAEDEKVDLDTIVPKSVRVLIARKGADRFTAALKRVRTGKQLYKWCES